MSEFKIHHHAAELLKLFNLKEGDGPEVYAEILTQDLTPYMTTQVSTHTAKRRIAEVSPTPQEMYKKYDELKAKNIRELDSLVYLLSSIVQEKYIVKFIEKNENERSKLWDSTFESQLGLKSGDTKLSGTSNMTPKEVQDLKTILGNITVSTSQNSTDVLLKALREKHAKVSLASGVPSVPPWTTERPYLTYDYVNAYRPQFEPPVQIGTLPLKAQERHIIEDFLFLLVGVEGKYITIKDEIDKKHHCTFTIDPTLDPSLQEIVNRMLSICSNYSIVCRFIEEGLAFEKGLVSHGLCSAMRSLFKDYFVTIAQLEQQYLQGDLSIQKLWVYIQPSLKTMDILGNVAIMIEKAGCKGAAILSLLHEKIESHTGDPKGKDLCFYLTQTACAGYFRILQGWIYEGNYFFQIK